MTPPTELRRDLSLFDLTMISIGSTIGSGIFLTPALITRTLEAPGWIAAAWVIGGLMALSGALTFSELGAMMPRAGGVYVFLTETYGGLTGFLFGWAYFLVANTGSMAALAVAFATYLGYLVPLGPAGVIGVAIGGIVLGLKVVRMNGEPVSFAVSLVRGLAAGFSAIVLFLGFFWIAWDQDRQGWHDKIAGTLVLRLPRGTPLLCL